MSVAGQAAGAVGSLPTRALNHLASSFGGELLRPGDVGYEQARRVWNARIDRRPALIARCASVDAVSRTLAFAREAGLAVTVRGIGHNVAGRAVQDGALMLDLRPMRAIDIDAERGIGRAQAGCSWGELDSATARAGLATPGARISTVGLAGVTLGGGYGWLTRSHGLTVDNVRAIEVVTADGRLLRASPSEHDDLFWGLRGGGTLAVATSFEYALHEVAPVLCGVLYYPAALTREVLSWYRERMRSASRELTIMFNLVVAPFAPFVPAELRGADVAALTVAHFGPEEQASADLEPVAELGRPLLASVRRRRYTTLQRLFDAAGAFGNCVHGRAGHLGELDDRLLDVLAAVRLSSPLSTVMIAPLGGAMKDVTASQTAFSQRDARFDIALDAVWAAGEDPSPHVRWTDALWSRVAELTDGAYVNELGDGEQERVQESYSRAALERLAAVRRAYDPDRLLCSWLPA